MAMTPNEQLDLVLNALKNSPTHAKFYEVKTKVNSDAEKCAAETLNEKMIDMILVKLEKDGYLFITKTKGTDLDNYTISFEGMLLSEIGGYKKKQESEEINEAYEKERTKQIRRNEYLIVWGTWFAGLVGAILLLWQIFLYRYPTYKEFYDHFYK